MVRPCSSYSFIARSVVSSRGRSSQSFFALPKPILPSVTRSFPHRNSARLFHAHSLRCYPYQSSPRDLALSDAQRRTIYALSTPPGKGGVAVIRVSGPDAYRVWKAVTRPVHASLIDQVPVPRLAELRHVIDPLTDEKLDDGLVLFFKRKFSSLILISLFIPTLRAQILYYGGCHRVASSLWPSGTHFGIAGIVTATILPPSAARRVHSTCL